MWEVQWSSAYFEKTKYPWGFPEGVRLPKLRQFFQSAIEMTAGTQSDSHGDTLHTNYCLLLSLFLISDKNLRYPNCGTSESILYKSMVRNYVLCVLL